MLNGYYIVWVDGEDCIPDHNIRFRTLPNAVSFARRRQYSNEHIITYYVRNKPIKDYDLNGNMTFDYVENQDPIKLYGKEI